MMRVKGTPAEALGLVGADDDAILAAMGAHPILINRPVVFGPKGIVLARPSEAVLTVLDEVLPGGFVKEDGKPV